MRRRTLIAGFGATISVVLLPRRTVLAQASKKVVRIGFLGSNAPVPPQPLLDGLRERGWKPGDFVLEARWAEGRPERFPAFAAELVALGVDVIFASSPPAVRAAQQATRTIPIIMFAVADPVQQGFIASLSRPGGNITGVIQHSSGVVPQARGDDQRGNSFGGPYRHLVQSGKPAELRHRNLPRDGSGLGCSWPATRMVACQRGW